MIRTLAALRNTFTVRLTFSRLFTSRVLSGQITVLITLSFSIQVRKMLNVVHFLLDRSPFGRGGSIVPQLSVREVVQPSYIPAMMCLLIDNTVSVPYEQLFPMPFWRPRTTAHDKNHGIDGPLVSRGRILHCIV